jgi:hypothetical protein
LANRCWIGFELAAAFPDHPAGDIADKKSAIANEPNTSDPPQDDNQLNFLHNLTGH